MKTVVRLIALLILIAPTVVAAADQQSAVAYVKSIYADHESPGARHALAAHTEALGQLRAHRQKERRCLHGLLHDRDGQRRRTD